MEKKALQGGGGGLLLGLCFNATALYLTFFFCYTFSFFATTRPNNLLSTHKSVLHLLVECLKYTTGPLTCGGPPVIWHPKFPIVIHGWRQSCSPQIVTLPNFAPPISPPFP